MRSPDKKPVHPSRCTGFLLHFFVQHFFPQQGLISQRGALVPTLYNCTGYSGHQGSAPKREKQYTVGQIRRSGHRQGAKKRHPPKNSGLCKRKGSLRPLLSEDTPWIRTRPDRHILSPPSPARRRRPLPLSRWEDWPPPPHRWKAWPAGSDSRCAPIPWPDRA